MIKRVTFLIYGLVAYASFLAVYLYIIGFVGNLVVPKSIDTGLEAPFATALLINLSLLVLLALQHSIMARDVFKKWWTTIVPRPIERSTYVLISDLMFALLFWQWRPMTGVVWEVENSTGQVALWCLFGVGWGLVLLSSFVIDHFDLFGLRQVFLFFRGKDYHPPVFKVSWFYKYIRHPLLLGWMIAFWATPRMTVGHLVFALGTTAYMLVAIQIEERDLAKYYGGAYADYRRRVPMLIPFPRRGSDA